MGYIPSVITDTYIKLTVMFEYQIFNKSVSKLYNLYELLHDNTKNKRTELDFTKESIADCNTKNSILPSKAPPSNAKQLNFQFSNDYILCLKK